MLMFNKTADWCRGTTGRAEGEQRGFASLLAFGTGFKHVNCSCIRIFSDFLCVDSLDLFLGFMFAELIAPVEIFITTTYGE